MGVFDKFKDLVGVGDEYDDEDYEPTEEEIEEATITVERNYERPSKYSRSSIRENNVVHMGAVGGSPMKLMVIEPTSFEESQRLVDSLKENKPVIINLEQLDAEVARKIFDFLSGATYALEGNVQKIANNIFIFAPENVDISSNDSSKEFNFGAMDSDTWR